MASPSVTTPSNGLGSHIAIGGSHGFGAEKPLPPPCTTLTGATSAVWPPPLPSEQPDFILVSDDLPDLLAVPDDEPNLIPTPIVRPQKAPPTLASRLSPELAHAPAIPALHVPCLTHKNILIENAADEPIGFFTERYRSLLKSFILGTPAAYHPDVTEQTGTEVWQKTWDFRACQGLPQADLLVLCLDPRNEWRFKWARQAFVREPIDYAGVLGSLLEHRLFHDRATWIFTPVRLDDPRFVEVYGEAFVRLIRTNFSSLHFAQPAPERLARHPRPAPAATDEFAQPPPEMFVDPDTGATWLPGMDQPKRAAPPPPAAVCASKPPATTTYKCHHRRVPEMLHTHTRWPNIGPDTGLNV